MSLATQISDVSHDPMAIAKVWSANTLAWATTIADIETFLGIISVSIAIAYTIWKWYREYNSSKKDKHENKSDPRVTGYFPPDGM